MEKYSIIEINEIKAKILKMYIEIQELKSRFRTLSYEFQIEDGFGHGFEIGAGNKRQVRTKCNNVYAQRIKKLKLLMQDQKNDDSKTVHCFSLHFLGNPRAFSSS
jgi:hypothetical protein